MKYIICSLFLSLSFSFAKAQSTTIWKDTDQIPNANSALLTEDPRFITINLEALQDAASDAPMEYTNAARNSNTIVNLPLPNGSNQFFQLVESPVMHPNLAAKFPELKSYRGFGINGKKGLLYLSVTPYGVVASISNEDGLSLIDYPEDGSGIHQTYYFNQMDHHAYHELGPPLACGFNPATIEQDITPDFTNTALVTPQADIAELRVYELALACTGEYGVAKGGTEAAVMASFVQALTLLNGVLQPEQSMKFEMIESNDLLINLDPATDFFTNANVGGQLLQQNQNYLNQVIGNNNFDIGHVFTMACTDVGGVVSGTACNAPNKGRGVTCHYANMTNIVYNVMAHEIDHQFSAGHTWANCPGIEGQLASGSAYEPGSGSTIMSYLGSCGGENINLGFGQNNTYYHVKSLEQVRQYSEQSTGNTCPDVIQTANHRPEVTHNHGNGFHIPKSTAFELEAFGTDEDGDDLTYCWEQYDLGPTTSINEGQIPNLTIPLFMSRTPTTDNLRSFPSLSLILQNQSNSSERLPSVEREMNFKCTVRDNNQESGGWNSTQVTFNVDGNSGPFSVTYPSASGDILEGGEQVTITWDPANSFNAPVNCSSVDIYLSTNSGFDFDVLLAEDVPNDGEHTFFLPDVSTFAGRIKIKASDNIFFDISNSNIQVSKPDTPYYGFYINSSNYQFACLPAALDYDFNFSGFNDFTGSVDLEIMSVIPDGMNLSWQSATMEAGEDLGLNVSFDADYPNAYTELEIRGIVENDTFYQSIFVETENADFSALALTGPANQVVQQPLATSYSWVEVPTAVNYDIQVADNPNFAPASIIDEEYGLTENFYDSDEPLNKGTVYFWRVRANANRCGNGDWVGPFYYQTFTEICETFTANGLPKNISPQLAAGASVVSELAAIDNSTITDINIANLDVSHDKLDDIKISVRSPQGTEVTLHEGTCILTSMKLSFDDESLADIPCPANTGELVQPVGNLSDFDGETLIGIWELVVTVLDEDGIGGKITNWELESCGEAIPNNPYIVNNEILKVRDGEGRWIETEVLQVADEDNTPDELIFTITEAPKHGEVHWAGANVPLGGTFKQISIDLNHVEYFHSGDGENDSFKFIVTDGQGGLLQETTVFIELDPNAPTSVNETIQDDSEWIVYPNPTRGSITVGLSGNWTTDLKQIKLTDVKGALLYSESIQNNLISKSIDLNHLPAGVYSIQLIGDNHSESKRVVISK